MVGSDLATSKPGVLCGGVGSPLPWEAAWYILRVPSRVPVPGRPTQNRRGQGTHPWVPSRVDTDHPPRCLLSETRATPRHQRLLPTKILLGTSLHGPITHSTGDLVTPSPAVPSGGHVPAPVLGLHSGRQGGGRRAKGGQYPVVAPCYTLVSVWTCRNRSWVVRTYPRETPGPLPGALDECFIVCDPPRPVLSPEQGEFKIFLGPDDAPRPTLSGSPHTPLRHTTPVPPGPNRPPPPPPRRRPPDQPTALPQPLPVADLNSSTSLRWSLTSPLRPSRRVLLLYQTLPQEWRTKTSRSQTVPP